MKLILLFNVLCIFYKFGSSFNIDTLYTVKELQGTQANTHFGYSVAIQNKSYVIVGAPLANTSSQNNEGALTRCSLADGKCTILEIGEDTLGDPNVLKQQRSYQRMGMSVLSQNEELFSCAPLWRNIEERFHWYQGRCSTLDKDAKLIHTNSPCFGKLTSNTYFGYCEAGFSSSGAKENTYSLYYVGIPGAQNFKGAIGIVVNAQSIIGASDQLNDISSLMGYSVAAGRFTSTSYNDAAGGAPRADKLTGKVIIYTVDFSRNVIKITTSISCPDSQIGQYFGAAVAAADLDNDGKDDLLVGAPLYSVNYNEGRVYVYMNTKGKTFSGFELLKKPLEGKSEAGAKFGSTISNLGDLNNDGYRDVAVGAPYGGEDSKGAVYIFNGGVDGIRQPYSQVLYAINNPVGAGFGQSISTGYDIDENTYPDFVVGAHLQNKAYVFRTRPVISIKDDLQLNVTSVPPELELSNCNGPNNIPYHCAEFLFNIIYPADGTNGTFDIEVTLKLDETKLVGIKRAFVKSDGETFLSNTYVKNVTLTNGKLLKNTVLLYFDLSADNDVETPITMVAQYKAYQKIRGCGNDVCPILDQYSTVQSIKQISYLKRCGNDSICNPDLVVRSKVTLPGNPNLNHVLYGVVRDINVEATIANTGEPAYQSKLRIDFSSDLTVVGVEIDKKPYILWKQDDVDGTTKSLSFPVANPLLATIPYVNVIAKFSIRRPRPTVKEYIFALEATSSGIELKKADNKNLTSIETKIQTCVVIQGDVKPSKIFYNDKAIGKASDQTNKSPDAKIKLSDIGQEVNYTFYIQNAGNTPVDTLAVLLLIVVKKDNLNLTYVVDLMLNDARCAGNEGKLNPNNLTMLYQQASSDLSGRKRREVEALKDDSPTNRISCRSGSCQRFQCTVNTIQPGEGAPIYIVTRLWAATLTQLKLINTDIETSILVTLGGQYQDQYVQKSDCNLEEQLTVNIRQEVVEGVSKKVQWWVILVSILAALILLAIVIAVLYRCGFFKRKDIKDISGPTGNEVANPQNEDEDDDE